MTVYNQPIQPTDVVSHSVQVYNQDQYKHLLAQQQLDIAAQQQVPSRADSGLSATNIINNKWQLVSRIGRGAFGDIWLAEPLQQYYNTIDVYGHIIPKYVAIKIERLQCDTQQQQRAVLKLETIVLKSLQKYPNTVSQLIEYGKDMQYNIAYLVMSLLGDNLLRLRKKRVNGRFTLATVLRFGISAIKAIQAIHTEGYIHRDIKPSNFVIGCHVYNQSTQSMDTQNIYMIDFGLARAYRDRHTGLVLESRGTIAGFRGTPRYASIHVHQNMDLGRRDDLWSLLYILIEFLSGDLPWGHVRDKDAIGAIKQQYIENPKLLLRNTTSCLLPFIKHLQSLQFDTQPNYDYLISLLYNKYLTLNLPYDYTYDWEINTTYNTATTTDTITYNNTDINVNYNQSPAVSPIKHRVERIQSLDINDNEKTLGKKQFHTMVLPSPMYNMDTPISNVVNNHNQHNHEQNDDINDAEQLPATVQVEHHSPTIQHKPIQADLLKSGVIHMKYCDASPSLTDMNHTEQHYMSDDNKHVVEPIVQPTVPIDVEKHYNMQDTTMQESQIPHTAPRIIQSTHRHSNSTPHSQISPPKTQDSIHHNISELSHVVIQPIPPSGPAPTFSHISKSFGRFAKKLLPHNNNKHRLSPTALQRPVVS